MSESIPFIDVVEEFPHVDRFHVANRDEEYYYCWLRNKPDNLEQARTVWGYEILGAKHQESALVAPNSVGERVMSDVVLARMPRERHEKIVRMKQRAADAAVGRATDTFRETVEKGGMEVLDETKIESRVGKFRA